MKIVKVFSKSSSVLFQILFALFAITSLFYISYILGVREYFQGRWGTDTVSALSTAAWIDKYFPKVPFWYPIAGGGVSITHSYPMLSFYLVSIIRRIFDLNLVQSFTFLGGISVPLMAVGIYAFGAFRLKNLLVGYVAAIFYLISPIAWVWLTDWGFYAESVSHIFVMPTLIFWDLFFTNFIKDPYKLRNKFYLLFTSVFLSLAFLSHFGSAFGIMGLFTFYIAFYAIREKERRKVFVRGLIAWVLVAVTFTLLSLFSSLPFYRYNRIASDGGLSSSLNYTQVKDGSLSFLHIAGLKPAITDEFYPLATKHVSYPAVVVFLGFLGAALAFRNSRSLAFAGYSIFGLFLSINADFLYWVVSRIPWPFSAFYSWRFVFIPLRGILPLLAAFGLFEIFYLLFFLLKGKLNFIRVILASILFIPASFYLIYAFGYLPKPEGKSLNYGAGGLDLRNIWSKAQDVCLSENTFKYLNNDRALSDFEKDGYQKWCKSALKDYFFPYAVFGWCNANVPLGRSSPLCEIDSLNSDVVKKEWNKCEEGGPEYCDSRFFPFGYQLGNPPPPNIISELKIETEYLEYLRKIEQENPQARIDFTPYTHGMAMRGPYVNLNKKLSQLYIYTIGNSSLNSKYYGQLLSALYIKDTYYGEDPENVKNLSRWFGINYLFLDDHTNIDLFLRSGWEDFALKEDEETKAKSGVIKFSEENKLAVISSKPTVLVIGDSTQGAYDQVYQISHYDTLPYSDFYIVRGKSSIDSYTLDDLKKFEVLLLNGYSYSRFSKADKLLSDYVMFGGNVFINTGWQYTSKDWRTNQETTLNIIPFNFLEWKDIGKEGKYEYSALSGQEINVDEFGPLEYGGENWGVSTSDPGNLKDWGKVVLSNNSHPLIAVGSIGKGKVVWSGLNLFVHAKQGASIYKGEIALLKNLFGWLVEGKDKTLYTLEYKRHSPDSLEFQIGENLDADAKLLWKESYHPDFKAYLSSRGKKTPLNISKAGPLFSLIDVPATDAGSKVILKYEKPVVETLSTVVSLVSFFILTGLILYETFSKKDLLFNKLLKNFEKIIDFIFFGIWKKLALGWRKNEDDGY